MGRMARGHPALDGLSFADFRERLENDDPELKQALKVADGIIDAWARRNGEVPVPDEALKVRIAAASEVIASGRYFDPAEMLCAVVWPRDERLKDVA